MDELAHQLGLDPIELRRRNEPEVGTMTKPPFSSRKLMTCVDHGTARSDWARRLRNPAR